MTSLEWTDDSVIRLIQEYRDRPTLWDTKDEFYRAQSAKYEAYTELASMFNCDMLDLRKKLNSVFASYRREKGKIRTGARSSWFLYNHMSFFPNHIPNNVSDAKWSSKRRRQSTPSPVFAEEEHLSDESNEPEYENRYTDEVVIKQEVVAPRVTSTIRRKKLHSKPRLTKSIKKPILRETSTASNTQLDSRLLETLKLLKRSDLSRKKDECDSFGDYIAISLRKHDDRTQSMIKQAINNILFEQEMKKYNNAAQYVVIANLPENPLTINDDSTDK